MLKSPRSGRTGKLLRPGAQIPEEGELGLKLREVDAGHGKGPEFRQIVANTVSWDKIIEDRVVASDL